MATFLDLALCIEEADVAVCGFEGCGDVDRCKTTLSSDERDKDERRARLIAATRVGDSGSASPSAVSSHAEQLIWSVFF